MKKKKRKEEEMKKKKKKKKRGRTPKAVTLFIIQKQLFQMSQLFFPPLFATTIDR